MTDGTDRASAPTRRQFLATTGLAVTAAVAGCQSDGGTANGTTSETPADTATADDPMATETPAPLGFPPGTSEAGIVAPDRLVEATQRALATTDYETTSKLVQSDLTVEQARRSSLDDQRQLQIFDAGSERNEIFLADGTTYIRSERDGEITYEIREPQQSFEDSHRRPQLGGAESLGGIIGQGSYTPVGTVRHNDRRVRSFTLESAQLPSDNTTVTDAEGSVLVDADSVVHEAILALEIEGESGAETLDRTFTVSALGPLDVPEPNWVETARQQQG